MITISYIKDCPLKCTSKWIKLQESRLIVALTSKLELQCFLWVIMYFIILYTGKFWQRKNLANLANCKLFTKIVLTNIQIYTETVFGICTDFSLFTEFFPTNSFACMVCQNFPHQNSPKYDIYNIIYLYNLKIMNLKRKVGIYTYIYLYNKSSKAVLYC